MADPGGAPPARAPPHGSRFFHFDIQIFRNIAASGVGAPPTRSAPPPYGKSWIRDCVLYIDFVLNVLFRSMQSWTYGTNMQCLSERNLQDRNRIWSLYILWNRKNNLKHEIHGTLRLQCVKTYLTMCIPGSLPVRRQHAPLLFDP